MVRTRLLLSLCITAVLALTAACGPGVRDQEDAGVVPMPDAPPAPIIDAGPRIDAAPLRYTMYAHSRDTLFVIDADTFDLTVIGTFDPPSPDLMTDLAVTPDGTVYGISNTKLYTIDPATAHLTFVANVPGAQNVALTFLPDGTLLASDAAGGVRSINPATGQVTEIGAFGSGYATAGDLVAVADGTMYAISDEGSPDAFTNNWLLTVDTATGVATGVGQIGFGQVFGVAYSNGHVYAFTSPGKIIEIDPTTGVGTEVKSYMNEFWGAGVTPLVPPIP